MAKLKKELLLKVEQAGNVLRYRLAKGSRLTVGQNPKNDITVAGDQFPKRHTLFFQKNNHFHVNLKKYMKGEVLAGESRLAFSDLIIHGVLPKRGDNFLYPITRGKKGHVVVGDAKISFQYTESVPQPTPAIQQRAKFEGFSWTYATLRELSRDLPFKAILLVLIIFCSFLLSYMNELSRNFVPPPRTQNVPERLAKIILKSSSVSETESKPAVSLSSSEEESSSKETEPKDVEKRREPVKPASQGLLGLLTGLGNTTETGTLADFLLDKGLVKELDQIMSSSDLTIGKGSGGDEAFDNLIQSSALSGGLDDILGGIDEVETISLAEKGQIKVERVTSMTGNQEALGQRSEESVRRTLLNYSGRLTYIYNKHLKRDANLSGKMVVEVVIAASGTVEDVNRISSTLNSPEFENEILSFIRRWQFQSIEQGSVTVTYPLVFNKIG